MLRSTQHASVIFVALLGCKCMRENKNRNRFHKTPKPIYKSRHLYFNQYIKP